MAWFDSVKTTITIKAEDGFYDLIHYMFYEYLEDAKLPVQEIFELDGYEMTQDEVISIIGYDAFFEAMEVIREPS